MPSRHLSADSSVRAVMQSSDIVQEVVETEDEAEVEYGECARTYLLLLGRLVGRRVAAGTLTLRVPLEVDRTTDQAGVEYVRCVQKCR